MALYSEEDLFILGIRRSGNHAIANWLLPHYNGLVRYLNDYTFAEQMRPDNQRLEGNPTYLYHNQQGQPLALMTRGQVWAVQELIAQEFVKRVKQQVHPLIQKLYQADQFERMINELCLDPLVAQLPFWADNDGALPAIANFFGCENQTPEKLAQILPQWQAAYERLVQANQLQVTRVKKFVLILRNPLNNLASLVKKPSLWPPNHITLEQFPETWIAYAKEYLGRTSHLKALGGEVICINYDFWFTDLQYRQALSQQLGKPFTDAGLEKVSLNGSGSSFNQLEFAHRAQEMRVLERWQEFQQDPQYRSLLQNSELLELYAQIYGKLPLVLDAGTGG